MESLAGFCAKPAALAGALKLAEDGEQYVEGDALEVMGELLRCCYRKPLDEVLNDAEARARAADGAAQVIRDEGGQQVRDALRGLSLEGLLALLWATSAKVAEAGSAPQATVARAYRHGDRFARPADSEVPLVIVCADTPTRGAAGPSSPSSRTGSPHSAPICRRFMWRSPWPSHAQAAASSAAWAAPDAGRRSWPASAPRARSAPPSGEDRVGGSWIDFGLRGSVIPGRWRLT